MPLAKTVGLEGTILGIEDDLGLSLEEQRQCAPCGANIDGLPEPIQN